MYYFYDKINQGDIVCLLYGGSLYLGESIMGLGFHCRPSNEPVIPAPLYESVLPGTVFSK